MPGSHHIPGATAKENRMYEHIKESELKAGKSMKTAKRIGAATTNKVRSERGETKSMHSGKAAKMCMSRMSKFMKLDPFGNPEK